MQFLIVVVSSGKTRPYLESAETVDRRWQELTFQPGFGQRYEMWACDKLGAMTFAQSYPEV